MKYSIIIVAYNAHEKLIRCLESLVTNPPETREFSHKADAEIILIDNSPEQIERKIDNRLVTRLLQTYVQVITEWHPENPGFAAACNIGASKSSGEFLVFANPDTEVFPNWAQRMRAHFKPETGAVGPISNFVAGFQKAEFHMQPAEDNAKTARLAARGNNLRGVETKLLIGFFLMIPKPVWDAVGGMDPQFFLGCDDLDLSLRIREAGYTLVIASDVFVYHFGHASFETSPQAAGLNKQSETKMLAKLKAQYGDKIPSSTELWGCEILPTYSPTRQTLSICMIVRNEMENLQTLLPQLGFADEIVIVNTDPERGPILNPDFEYNPPIKAPPLIRIGDFPWTDSFAEARNFSLSKCTGDWVLWLDADDRISPESAALIRAALDNPGPRTQAKTVHFGLTLRDDGPDGFNYADGQPRLFPRVPGLEWEGRVHESYMDAAARLGIEKLDVPNIIIDHTGYKDPAVMLKKHERNLRLMRMETDSPKKFYHMGKNLMALGHYLESEECFRRVLDGPWAQSLETVFRDQVRTCMAALIMAVKGPDEDADAYLEENGKPDALMLRAEIAFKRGQIYKAEAMYKEYAAFGPIQDPHGCQQEYFRRVCGERLAVIAEARRKVFGEVPA
jgi:GT2 family glycosyltransferase